MTDAATRIGDVDSAWPTEEQVWDCIRLTFEEPIARRLSFKRWKDGIDIDYPTHEAMSFARQLFAMGFVAGNAPAPAQAERYPRRGIYIASKTRHADRWLAMRHAGLPIISTWIDEAGEGQSADLDDLWRRCLSEASTCAVLIVYREPEDILKGAWVEMGAALARGTPVFAVGLREYTIANYRGIRHFDTIEEAFAAWTVAFPAGNGGSAT